MSKMPDRINWKNKDWANLFGCSVRTVQRYRAVMKNNFYTAVALHRATGKYCFCLYEYEMGDMGKKYLSLSLSSNEEFDNKVDAVEHANKNIIPTLQLTEFWSKYLHVPREAIQMLVIDKQKA